MLFLKRTADSLKQIIRTLLSKDIEDTVCSTICDIQHLQDQMVAGYCRFPDIRTWCLMCVSLYLVVPSTIMDTSCQYPVLPLPPPLCTFYFIFVTT